MPELPGQDLARELIEKSRSESRATPVEEVIQAICGDGLDDGAAHRLIGRLWTLERMFYYIYGGWGQGLEINDFPPSIKYLFSKQIVDESTHEMLYLDALLRKGFAATQKDAFRHPSGCFVMDSALAYYVFSLRNLATYPHPIRIAALNLGPKVLELGWMEGLTEAIADPDLKGGSPTGRANQALGTENGFDYSFVPGTGHMLQVENPDACARLTLAFLKECGLG